MEPTNNQKSTFAIKYARHLLDDINIVDKSQTLSLKEYAHKFNEFRKDGNLAFTQKQAREYLFDIAVNNKGVD